MEWFGHALAQGYAHSLYRPAISQLKGFKTKLNLDPAKHVQT
jgi:hypothetical protein